MYMYLNFRNAFKVSEIHIIYSSKHHWAISSCVTKFLSLYFTCFQQNNIVMHTLGCIRKCKFFLEWASERATHQTAISLFHIGTRNKNGILGELATGPPTKSCPQCFHVQYFLPSVASKHDLIWYQTCDMFCDRTKLGHVFMWWVSP